MKIIQISKTQAGNYLLHKAGLNSNRSLAEIFFDLSCVQIDPINVVARSHELSLYNRNKKFEKSELYEGLYEKHVFFEHWMQRYSIIPIVSFPYLKALMNIEGDWHTAYYDKHKKELDAAVEFISDNGPATAKDLLHIPKVSSVRSWKGNSSQIALLEYLWDVGQIMIVKKANNTKYYDLTEKVLPKKILKMKVSEDDAYECLLKALMRYSGIMRSMSVTRSGTFRGKGIRRLLQRKIKRGEVLKVQIEESNTVYFVHKNELQMFLSAKENSHIGINILSPLDPLVIDRQLLIDVFDFNYLWEGYTPAAKRKYGYYNMPILFNGRFVGQIDLSKESTKKKLSVNNLVLAEDSSEMRAELNKELNRLTKFSFQPSM